MRQAGFEPTTFGSGGGPGRRPPTLAGVVSGTCASGAAASASQRRPRCYHRCYNSRSPSVSWRKANPVRASGAHRSITGVARRISEDIPRPELKLPPRGRVEDLIPGRQLQLVNAASIDGIVPGQLEHRDGRVQRGYTVPPP